MYVTCRGKNILWTNSVHFRSYYSFLVNWHHLLHILSTNHIHIINTQYNATHYQQTTLRILSKPIGLDERWVWQIHRPWPPQNFPAQSRCGCHAQLQHSQGLSSDHRHGAAVPDCRRLYLSNLRYRQELLCAMSHAAEVKREASLLFLHLLVSILRSEWKRSYNLSGLLACWWSLTLLHLVSNVSLDLLSILSYILGANPEILVFA